MMIIMYCKILLQEFRNIQRIFLSFEILLFLFYYFRFYLILQDEYVGTSLELNNLIRFELGRKINNFF